MRILLTTAAFWLACIGVCSAQLSRVDTEQATAEKEIRAAYARYDRAVLLDDPKALDSFNRDVLAEDYVLVDRHGEVTTRTQLLNLLKAESEKADKRHPRHPDSKKSTITHIEVSGDRAVVLLKEVQSIAGTDGIDPNTPGPEGGLMGSGRGLRITTSEGQETWVHVRGKWKLSRTQVTDTQEEFLYQNSPGSLQ